MGSLRLHTHAEIYDKVANEKIAGTGKYGDTLIGTLRSSYGFQFARGCADNEKLSEVLAKLDEPSLFKLVRDHKAGMLPVRLRTFFARRR